MLQKIIFLLALTIGFQTIAVAQDIVAINTATVYSSLSARKYKIILNSNKRIVARSLDSLKGNVLYTSGKNGLQEVSTEFITKLFVAKGKSRKLIGFTLGALSGAASGALIGLSTYRDSQSWVDFGPSYQAFWGGFAGFLVGSITGTLIGASSYRYIHYDFSEVPPPDKYALLSRILSGK